MSDHTSDLLRRLGFSGADEVKSLLGAQTAAPSEPAVPHAQKPAPKLKIKKTRAPSQKTATLALVPGKKISSQTKLTPGDTVQVTISGRESVPVINVEGGAEASLGVGSFFLTVQSVGEELWLVTKSGYGNSLDVFFEAQKPGRDVVGDVEIRAVEKAQPE